MTENNSLSNETSYKLDDRYLIFNIDGSLYGIPLTLVLEIINIQRITHIPNVVNYVKGIVNLRGKVVPIIDVRLKMGLPEREYDDKTCIVVLDIHDMHIGLIVDSVSEVATIQEDKLANPPEFSNSQVDYLSSVSKLNGNVVLNLDCDKFLSNDVNTIM